MIMQITFDGWIQLQHNQCSQNQNQLAFDLVRSIRNQNTKRYVNIYSTIFCSSSQSINQVLIRISNHNSCPRFTLAIYPLLLVTLDYLEYGKIIGQMENSFIQKFSNYDQFFLSKQQPFRAEFQAFGVEYKKQAFFLIIIRNKDINKRKKNGRLIIGSLIKKKIIKKDLKYVQLVQYSSPMNGLPTFKIIFHQSSTLSQIQKENQKIIGSQSHFEKQLRKSMFFNSIYCDFYILYIFLILKQFQRKHDIAYSQKKIERIFLGYDIIQSINVLLSMLKIFFVNWNKQNNQTLCDFKQISQIKPDKLQLYETGTIYRRSQDYTLTFLSKKKVPINSTDKLDEPILYITQIDGQYKITDLKNENNNQCLLLLAPTINQKQQQFPRPLQIAQGSTLKIGKILLKVQKLRTKDAKNRQNLYNKIQKQLMQPIRQVSRSDYTIQSYKEKQLQHSTLQISQIDISQKKLQQLNYSQQPINPICKVCYSRTFQQDNKLISLCKCTGSTKFIHEKCLRKWVKRSSELISIQKNFSKSIFIASMKGFVCEICKQQYPLDDIIQLIFDQNENKLEQFIVISSKGLEKQRIFIINLQKTQQIRIGREQINDIILNDMSVSRSHCVIKYDPKQKQAQLIDLDSKFGSGIKKSSIVLTEKRNDKLKLQKGRTYLKLQIVKQKKSFLQKFGICNYQ